MPLGAMGEGLQGGGGVGEKVSGAVLPPAGAFCPGWDPVPLTAGFRQEAFWEEPAVGF